MRKLTEEERERVKRAVSDRSQVANLQTTEELHLFVEKWNFGDFPEPLFSIIRHPECDKGTALYIYWLNDPVSYFELYASANEASLRGQYELDNYNLLTEIQERLNAGFYEKETISIDPQEVAVGELTSPELKTPVLDVMMKPSKPAGLSN
jgi:hypothetical protein